MERLSRTLRAASLAPTPAAALDLVLQWVIDHCNADACALYSRNPDAAEFRLIGSKGGRKASHLPVGPASRIAERREPVRLDRLKHGPTGPLVPQTTGNCLGAYLGIPVIRFGRSIAVLEVLRDATHGFADEDATVLLTLGAQITGLLGDVEIQSPRTLIGQRVFFGAPGSPGVAIGIAVPPRPEFTLASIPDKTAPDVAAEIEDFEAALGAVRVEIQTDGSRLSAWLPGEVLALYDVYAMLLDDNDFLAEVTRRIHGGLWAPAALRDGISRWGSRFDAMEDDYLRGRSEDIRALGQRIFLHLSSGLRNPGLYPERAVLLGEEVGLPRMSGISPERLSGMVCTRGSVLSHGVVTARALGIAAVVGVEDLPLSQCEGREIIADAGSDKALPYLPMHESNPALGQRGIRLSLEYPGMFLVQLRAMLRANVGLGNLRLLLPMVTLPKELDEAKALIEQALDDLHSSGISVPSPPVGIMLEVPAAVFRAAELAVRADFVSIGSNDLTQYILAADHTNPHVTTLCDPMSPAVLEAIGMAVERVRTCAIPVSVCGEMAGDPLAAPLLLGLGVDALSMSPRSIPRVKQVIRKFDTSQAHDLWQRALACRDAIQVRSLLAGALDAAGLGGLVRAGK